MRWTALALAAPFALAASRAPVDDVDVFWHLADARLMLDQGLFATDAFAHTAAGRPVELGQWLGELALWSAFALGSWWGVVVLRALVVFALSAIVLHGALRVAPRLAVAVAAAAPSLALGGAAWTDRPQLLGMLLFAAFISLALALRRGSRWAAVLLPPLLALWANVHGSFAVGSALVVVLVAETVLFAPQRRGIVLASGAVSLAATFLTPLGPLVYASPLSHFATPPRFILEWQPPDVATPHGALYAAILLVTLDVAMLAGGGTSWAALLVPLAFLSAAQQRHMPLFALAAVPYLAEYLPAALARLRLHVAPAPSRAGALPSTALALAVLALAVAAAPREPDLRHFPVEAVGTLGRAEGALFNEYDWGGFLIWSAPRSPVFIDGRLRPFLGDVVDEYVAAINLRPDWAVGLERHRVSLVLVRPERALAVHLRRSGWRALAEEPGRFVLLERP